MTCQFNVARYSGGWERFQCDLSAEFLAELSALPRGTQVMTWLAERLGDQRFWGHAMVWERV